MEPRGADPAWWQALPPLEEAMLPEQPPPAREPFSGICIGSEMVSALGGQCRPTAGAEPMVDLGEAVCNDLFALQPGLVDIARLGAIDFSALTPAERVDALIAFERHRAWADARQQELLSLISVWDASEKLWSVEEVGCALRVAGQTAETKLRNAERLCTQLPMTLQALSAGRIAAGQATAIVEASYELPDQVLPDYEDRVLRHADEQSLAQTKRTAKRAALTLDPASAQQRHERAVADRHVRIAPADHGMAWLVALLPAADAQAVYARLDGAARRVRNEDPRTLDQLRADALVDGVLTGIDGDLPAAKGRRPAISVVVTLPTLVGQDDEPGWLDGYGPIPADYAREIAHDPTGTWRRLVTDPVDGQLLEYGRVRYRPPRHLADHVIARDGTCTFPFCSHTARAADLDHVVAYPRGATEAANLQPLDRRHHNAKTLAGWLAERDPKTGNTNWTSPQGRTYRTRPPERWTSRPDAGKARSSPRSGNNETPHPAASPPDEESSPAD